MSKKIIEKQLEIAGVNFHLFQKRMRNLRLRIIAPHGEVRVSAPLRCSLVQIKKFVLERIDWIKKHQLEIRSRKTVAPLKFMSGEKHYIFAEEYLLEVVESELKKVIIKNQTIELHLKKGLTKIEKSKILDNWYRAQLKKIIPNLIADYEPKMGVKVAEFGVKKMKTRWGTCSLQARRIWINLELAKRPPKCLEFIVVHEMVHLLERNHNKRFYALMDKFMPDWKIWQDKLKELGIREY
ncbi:MAG: SprT family zinc-dependent metalloprotease [Pseudomonadota bacterium]